MNTIPTRLSLTLALLATTAACGVESDEDATPRSALHEVYLGEVDGPRLTLGHYDPSTQTFFPFEGMGRLDGEGEPRSPSLLVELGEDDSILLEPGAGDAESGVVLVPDAEYRVSVVGIDGDAEPLGFARLDPEPLDAASDPEDAYRYASNSGSWGWAEVDCTINATGVNCSGAVDDTKTDGYCVYIYHTTLTQSGWTYLSHSCGAVTSFWKHWGHSYPSGTFLVTRGPLGSHANYFTLSESLL